jgi:PTH1 family peptidyl-tRNA hydrolase
MKLIAGLGNPGDEYAGTRHNAGFMTIERLARRHDLVALGSIMHKFHSAVIEGPIAGERCILLQPQTYMNRSGTAVRQALQFYKLNPATDLLVVVDDTALSLGRIRLRAEGSPGGHNGLADIQRALGTAQYPRLRIGIDTPPLGRQVDYVLSRFTPAQMQTLDRTLDLACDAIECWVARGIDAAMTRYNPPIGSQPEP